MLTKTTVDAVFTKLAAGEGKWYDGIKNWATADNNSNLKDLGIGVGTAVGTYALSGLLPNAKKHRLARLAASVAAGGAAGHYGKDIRNFDYGKLNPWRGNTAKPARGEADEFEGPPPPMPKVQPVTIPPMPKVQPVTIPPMPKVQPITPAPKAKAQALSDSDWSRFKAFADNPQPTLLEQAMAASERSRAKAKAQGNRDIEALKGKTSYGEFKNLIAAAKAAPVAPAVGPTLANAAAPPASAREQRPVVPDVPEGYSGTVDSAPAKFRALLDAAKAAPVAPAVGPTLANAAALKSAEIAQGAERRQKYQEVIKNLRSKLNDPVQVVEYVPGPSREEVASSNAARKVALAKKKKKEQELKNKAIADEYAKGVHAQADAPSSPALTSEDVRRAKAKRQQRLTQDALRRGRFRRFLEALSL